jgi:membrane protein
LPGASGAALIWFLATLGFGFYLTRFADYSVVYGPLGAVVATLVWLYIATVSVLIGAEFNAHVFPKPLRSQPALAPANEEKLVTAGEPQRT